MAHISRMSKSEVPVLVRVCYNYYNCQRRDYTYYEVLRISPNATQKDIKDAYIKLSKELHPDCLGKGNHADFVKINEAYKVLSKKKSKQDYDMELKCNNVHPTSTRRYHGYHNTSKQWEQYNVRYTRNGRTFSKEERIRAIKYCILLITIGSFLQILYIARVTDLSSSRALEKHKKIQLEYQRTMEESKNKTVEEKLLRIMKLSEEYGLFTKDE